MRRTALALFGLAAFAATPAQALCIYNGKDNVRTTLAQEFHDSRWVVRAHVEAADYHWSDIDESWTLYHLRVVDTLKGKLGLRFSLFTTRDSGGFYLEGNDGSATPDMDHDWLLFLTPMPYPRSAPHAAQQALAINYNCGQSKAWPDLSPAELNELARLAKDAPGVPLRKRK